MLRLIDEGKKILPKDSYKKIEDLLETYKSRYFEILFQLKKRNPPETKPTKLADVFTA